MYIRVAIRNFTRRRIRYSCPFIDEKISSCSDLHQRAFDNFFLFRNQGLETTRVEYERPTHGGTKLHGLHKLRGICKQLFRVGLQLVSYSLCKEFDFTYTASQMVLE